MWTAVESNAAREFPDTTNCVDRHREHRDEAWLTVKCGLVGRQGRWWLKLRGTQLMMSYDVAARQSLTECYQESRLLYTRIWWCHVLLSRHHSNGIHHVPRMSTDCEKTWRCRRRWIRSHSSSLFVAVTNVVYSDVMIQLLCCNIMLHDVPKTYVFLSQKRTFLTPAKINQLYRPNDDTLNPHGTMTEMITINYNQL